MTTSAAFDPAKLGVPIDQWEVGLKISCSAISLSSFTLINLPLPFSVGVFSELNPSCKRGCAFSELNLSSDFLLFLSSGVHGNRHRGGTWRLAIRLRSRRELAPPPRAMRARRCAARATATSRRRRRCSRATATAERRSPCLRVAGSYHPRSLSSSGPLLRLAGAHLALARPKAEAAAAARRRRRGQRASRKPMRRRSARSARRASMRQ